MKLISTVFLTLLITAAHSQSFYSAQRAGNIPNEYGNAIVTDAAGNIFVAGMFVDSIKFGSLPTLIGSNTQNIFIVKYNASGVALWSKKYVGASTEYATGIKLDASGNIYLCGIHSGNVDFDGIAVTTTNQNIFVAKLNSSGVAQWAVTAGSSMSDDYPRGLDIDGNGNVYVTGSFSGIASFGNGISLTSTIHPLYLTHSIDLFIAKFNNSGVCQWASKGSSYQTDYSYGIATDQSGNSYITGFIGQTADFSGYTVTYQGGGVDMIIAGYNSSGTLILLISPPPVNGYADYEAGYGIELDPQEENFYVTGLFSGYLPFGDDTIQSNGSYDMFIVKYNKSTGIPVWVRDTYSTQWESGERIAVDNIGNVYVAFEHYHSGTPPFPQVTFNSAGYYDPVVVKYTNEGEFVWANRGGSTNYDYPLGLALGDSGKVWMTGSFGNPATFGSYNLSHSGNASAQDYFLVQLRSDLVTGTLADDEFCAGENVDVPFTAYMTFNGGNIFTAQLSDGAGSFVNPVNIGALNGTTSGIINAQIPFNTLEGSNYRIRVISSDSIRNGGDNGTDLIIHGVPSVEIISTGDTVFCNGNSGTLEAMNNGTVTFQWYKNAVAINGADSNIYHPVMTGDYHVVITNASNCTFTSNTIHITVNPLPTASITAGGPATFCNGGSVTMNSNTNNNFSYQWKLNAVIISGATTSVYTANASGTYTIEITNQYGCKQTSNSIVVIVNPKPSASITAGGPVVFCQGSNVTLNANTGALLSYQWQKNSQNINGATNASYTANQSGTYRVVVSNQYGCTKNSSTITVIVNLKPSATITPQGTTTFCLGDSVILSANTGSGLTYKWKLNNQNIQGATNSNYTAFSAGTYKVQVTNAEGCKKTSQAVTVSVPCKLENEQEEMVFEIYPNPASTNFSVFSADYSGTFHLQIFNLVGQIVLDENVTNQSVSTFDVSLFACGKYHVVLRANEFQKTFPLEIIR